MKITIFLALSIILLMVLGSLLTLKVKKLNADNGISWQQSMSPEVQLGARDKFGVLGRYAALFVVTDAHGKSVSTMRSVAHDDWVFVYFPADFPYAEGLKGQYNWKCLVKGQQIANGSFSMNERSLKIAN